MLDPATEEVVGAIEIVGLEYPHHVYLDTSGDRMLVAVPGIDLAGGHGGGHGGGSTMAPMGAVLLLDASDGELLAYRGLEGTNHNAIVSPDGSEVWTSENHEAGGAVVILDAETLEDRGRVEVGEMASEVTFGPDGRHGFVCNGGSGSVSVIDVQSRQVVAEIDVGQTPVGAWPGADGLMYVDNEGSQTLSVIDPVTLAVVRTYALGFTPAFAAIAPTGELWVTDTDGGRVVAYDAAAPEGTAPARELATGAGAHAIAFSPDGTKAYVTNQLAGTVTVLGVEDGATLATTTVGAAPNGLVVRSAR